MAQKENQPADPSITREIFFGNAHDTPEAAEKEYKEINEQSIKLVEEWMGSVGPAGAPAGLPLIFARLS